MRKFNTVFRLLGVTCIMQLIGILPCSSQSLFASVSAKKTSYTGTERTYKPAYDTQKQDLFSVLKELNKEKGVYFLFSNQEFAGKLVNPISQPKDDVEKILDQVLANTGLTYKKVSADTYVIISMKEKEDKPNGANTNDNIQSSSQTASVSITSISNSVITGQVTAQDGTPLKGVSVVIKGSSNGTTTNAGGVFTLNANKGDVLVFSYIGYALQEYTVGSSSDIKIVMQSASQQMTEVVVTALGIQRRAKDLTYSTQKLTNADLTTVKDANFINSLSGKVAGVTITKSSSGLGGSARVILRGNKSTRENQPLYVVDGIPLANVTPAQPTDVWGQASGAGSSGRDGGDGISNINPDDIESLTILKGASAAALYGSQAANGVILITTKSGKAGKARINFSSDLTMESPLYYPETQFKYGQTQGDPTDQHSWGPAVNAPDHIKPFYQTGVTAVNSLSLTAGTEKAQTYFSYANTSSKGIMPTSSFVKHNLNFRETAKFFDDKLTIDANLYYINQKAKNRPVSGLYANPLTGLYIFPRGLDFDEYKNNFEYFSPTRNMYLQNWFDLNYDKNLAGQDFEQNPYWILNRMPRTDKRNRAFGNLILKYKLSSWLNVQARGNFDKTVDVYDSRMYAGTMSVQAAPNGRYTYDNATYTQLYGDVLLNANKDLSKSVSLSATLGTSINDSRTEDINFDTDPNTPQGLYYADKFGVNFITSDALISNQALIHKQQQAVFANAELSYKNFIFLDVTGRNDWSSTFAFTPTANKGYFYYSFGGNIILSDAVTMPSAISFSKLRVSYAKVGNDIPAYITNPPDYYMNNRQGAQFNTKVPLPGTYIQPEDNRSFEVGTEWRFMKDRAGIDFTYYKNNNYRQYVEISAPLGSGYSTYYLNLGNIQNNGVEATVYVTPVSNSNLKWTSTFNFASNKNKVVSLSDPSIPGSSSSNAFILTGAGVNMYQSEIVEGGSWGDIYGYYFQRAADGSILVGDDGKPMSSNGTGSPYKLLGNPNPDFTLGWDNTINIKDFTVGVLIDGRFGGEVMSVTQAVLDAFGASEASATARDNGGVNIDATVASSNQHLDGPIDAQTFYGTVGNRNGISEYYMYDATAIRLREFSLTYKLPVQVKGVSNISVGLIGRNLFFISKKAPFDPEITMATSNALQGIDAFGIPSTRSIGASVKVTF